MRGHKLMRSHIRLPKMHFGVPLTVAMFVMGAAFCSSESASAQPNGEERLATATDQQNQEEAWSQRATDPVAVGTFLLAVVGAGQLALFYWQLKLIRESLADAKEAADAAQGAAKAAEKQAKIAERSLTDLQRAFVFIDGFNIELTTARDSDAPNYEWVPEPYRQDPGVFITRFAAQPRWKNGGNTPTDQLTTSESFLRSFPFVLAMQK